MNCTAYDIESMDMCYSCEGNKKNANTKQLSTYHKVHWNIQLDVTPCQNIRLIFVVAYSVFNSYSIKFVAKITLFKKQMIFLLLFVFQIYDSE